MNRYEFIEYIKDYVTVENAKRGNPLYNSVVIAQACLETGFGTSKIMMEANAPFGIKAGKNWKGKVYNAKTKEFYNGTSVNITDCFRAYNTIAEGISDYFDLITKSERYRKACTTTSSEECIKEIFNGGYATDPTYVDTIIFIINEYDLKGYDQLEPENIYYIIGKTYELAVNLNVRRGPGIDYGIKEYFELTEDGKKHATNQYFATLEKGTKVTCKEIIHKGLDIWIVIPSGYVAAYYKGKRYVI